MYVTSLDELYKVLFVCFLVSVTIHVLHGVCSCCVYCWPLFNGPNINQDSLKLVDCSIVIYHAVLKHALGTCEKAIMQTVMIRILTLKLLNAKISDPGVPRRPSVQSRYLLIIKRDLDLPSVLTGLVPALCMEHTGG